MSNLSTLRRLNAPMKLALRDNETWRRLPANKVLFWRSGFISCRTGAMVLLSECFAKYIYAIRRAISISA